jgi:hypothetical protein
MRDLQIWPERTVRPESIRTGRRGLFAVIALLLVFPAWGVRTPPAVAQDATPTALEETEAVATAIYYGREGREIGQIVINRLTDPFEDYNPNSPHDRTSHYVELSLSVKNTGVRPFRFDPRGVNLYDSDGFLYTPTSGIRSEAAQAIEPNFSTVDLVAGDEVRGAITFQVLNGVQLDSILFIPDDDRLVVLADLRDEERAAAAPRLGSPRSVIGPEGSEIARITMTRIVDPLDDYDPSRLPARGYHYVLVDLTIVNTGTQPFGMSGGRFYLQDTAGYAYFPVNIRRRAEVLEAEPPLANTDLAGGDQISGVLIYEIPNDATLARYFFNTRTEHHVTLLVEFETSDAAAPTPDPAGTPGSGGSSI